MVNSLVLPGALVGEKGNRSAKKLDAAPSFSLDHFFVAFFTASFSMRPGSQYNDLIIYAGDANLFVKWKEESRTEGRKTCCISMLHVLGIGLELACNRGLRGIFLFLMMFSRTSLHCKLVPVSSLTPRMRISSILILFFDGVVVENKWKKY